MEFRELVREQLDFNIAHYTTHNVSAKRKLAKDIGEYLARKWGHITDATYGVGFPWYVTGDYTPPEILRMLQSYKERIESSEVGEKELRYIWRRSLPCLGIYMIFRTPKSLFHFLEENPYEELAEEQRMTCRQETLDIGSFKRLQNEFEVLPSFMLPQPSEMPKEPITRLTLDLNLIPDRSFVYTLSKTDNWQGEDSMIRKDVMFSLTPICSQPKYDEASRGFVRRVVRSESGADTEGKLERVRKRFSGRYATLLEDDNVLRTWKERITAML